MSVPLVLLLTGMFHVAGLQERRREYWPDGSLREEYEVVLGADGHEEKSGVFRAWSQEGKLVREGTLKAGEEIGKWTFFHPSGQPAAEGTFARGLRTGLWKTYHENGALASRGRYESGERAGPWVFQRADGTPDALHSGEYTFESRQVGQRCFKGPRLDGERHGPWIAYWPSLQPLATGEFERGARSGEWLLRDPNGRPVRLLSGRYAGGTRSELDGLAPAPALGSFAPVLDSPLGTPTDAPAVKQQLATWLALDPRAFEARLQEVESGAEALPWVTVEALPVALRTALELELDSPAGRQALARLERCFLSPLCGGRSLAPARSDFPKDAEEARAFLHAWTTLWAATREDLWFWHVDLAAPRAAAPEIDLREPPLFAAPAVSAESAPAPYAQRFVARRGRSEEILQGGLDWLAGAQAPGGGWRAVRVPGDGPGAPGMDVGVTGLALLAFLGSGLAPSGDRHAETLVRAVVWLLSIQDERGAFLTSFEDEKKQRWIRYDWLPGHMVATQALAEVLALQPSPGLRARVQRAVDLIHQARNPYGAWRYDLPPVGDNDAIVTAWAVQALQAASVAGLAGDHAAAFQGALGFLDEVTDLASGRAGYQAFGDLPSRYAFNEHFPREKVETPTAATILVRRLLGQTLEEAPILGKHIERVRSKPPLWDPDGFGTDEAYLFFGSQGLALGDARVFAPWQKALSNLLESQRVDGVERGSFDPIGAWGAVTGRIGTTALLLLALEAPFRLTLPPPPEKARKASRSR